MNRLIRIALALAVGMVILSRADWLTTSWADDTQPVPPLPADLIPFLRQLADRLEAAGSLTPPPPIAPPDDSLPAAPPPHPIDMEQPAAGPRDPFTASRTMELESQRRGMVGATRVLPQLSLKGCATSRNGTVAWLANANGDLILVRDDEPFFLGGLEIKVVGLVEGALELEIPELEQTLSLR